MIHPDLDLAARRTQLPQSRVLVTDYLQSEAAERLRKCLALEVPWTLALRDAGSAHDRTRHLRRDNGRTGGRCSPAWSTLSTTPWPARMAVLPVVPARWAIGSR